MSPHSECKFNTGDLTFLDPGTIQVIVIMIKYFLLKQDGL